MSTEVVVTEGGQTELVVEGTSSNVIVPVNMTGTVELSIVGGPPGVGGARYTHNQPTPSTEWIVNHNLGVLPAGVSVYSVGGVLVEAHIVHVSNNQLRVLFTNPYIGRVAII